MKSNVAMRLLRIILLFALILAIGCDDDSSFVPTLDVMSLEGERLSGAALHLSATADEKGFKIASNSTWHVKCEAEWLTVTPSSGRGDVTVRLSVGEATSSRSAVVSVMSDTSSQLYQTFDVVQWVTSPDNPTDDPNAPNNPDNPPGDDPGTGGGNGDEPTDDDNDNPNPNPNPEPETPIYGDYGEAINLAAIHAGRYYIGGLKDENLHLALGEITPLGHCRTALFSFNQNGVPVGEDDSVATVVALVEADQGFYLYFEECGYLKATADKAGALTFCETPDVSWQFAVCDGGGYYIRQVGEINAQLIFSQRAQQDLLRSIGGDDEGGLVRLFLLNE